MKKLYLTTATVAAAIVLSLAISLFGVPAVFARIYNPAPSVDTSAFVTSSALSNYLPLTGGILTGNLVGTYASLSGNFEIGNNALRVLSTGVINAGTWNGTAIDEAYVDWVVTTQAVDLGGATSFEIPNAASPTVDATGELALQTGSKSLDLYEGAAVRVMRTNPCFTYAFEAPTTTENWGSKKFLDPFTITEVSVLASGTNAVGWNLNHGPRGAITTALFAANKSASSSTDPVYTSFADATLTDGSFLQLVISSASATIENLDVTVCGYYNH